MTTLNNQVLSADPGSLNLMSSLTGMLNLIRILVLGSFKVSEMAHDGFFASKVIFVLESKCVIFFILGKLTVF